MGGYRSNRWGTYERKVCVEECLILDVNMLLSHSTGSKLTCTWSRCENKRASIDVKLRHDSVLLGYSATKLNQEPISIDTAVPFLSHPMRPNRRYFGCPSCGRRCEKLYLPPGQFHFKCRHCYNLTYRTRQEHRKYQSLAKVMAESSPWSVKHWNAFLNNRW